MMTKIILKILFTFILTLSSCNNNAQEEKFIHKVFPTTDLPLKIKTGDQKRDSIPISFYIPKEFNYINNSGSRLKIKHTFWSKKSPNIRSGNIYFLHNGKFVKGIRTEYLEKGQEQRYKSFVSFEFLLSQQEYNELFSKEYEKNKYYDLEFSPTIRSFLNKRISEKGFIISLLFDINRKKNIIDKIPFDF
ncbi:hypothetical protein [Aquimarina latercula]|uniref:hypothetical protein n=1 Tax=Aquimarina latercula TaxID=987 RepID=UPI0012DFBD81|nr:hypothetical protein [Aquimarina latercula]